MKASVSEGWSFDSLRSLRTFDSRLEPSESLRVSSACAPLARRCRSLALSVLGLKPENVAGLA
jgi:hypothetical protein